MIVLFKNRKKSKLIKSFVTYKNAEKKFKELINKNNSLVFHKKIENATEVTYELGLLTNKEKTQKSLFVTDELGRNNPVNLDDSEYVFLDIKPYKKEELIFDWQIQSKISFDDFLKKYCNSKELKSIFTLYNKICVQINEDVSIFSLKNENESERFLDVLRDYFIQNNRMDALFIKDVSSSQRKWIYDLLEKKGFNKKRLYRQKTTFSKR